MDRELTPDIRRRAAARRWLKIALPLIIVVAAMVMLPGWLRPSLSRERIRTARVTVGALDAGFTAAGTVVPEVERVISSPLDARVLRVLRRPGAALKAGDPVVALDVSESTLAAERSQSDLRLKENLREQTRLGYEQALAAVDRRMAIKRLELESRKATLDGYRKLADGGLISAEELRKAVLAVQQAEIELAQLVEERASTADTTTLRLQGLALEQASLDRELTERKRVLELATTKSDRDGVLTWVVSEEGALVRKGDVLARIADLSSFRVEATASDVHAGQVQAGMPVVVRFDDVTIEGRVSEVYPAVQNAMVRFNVALETSAHPRLRASLRVDIQVVTDRKTKIAKVARGPFAEGLGARQVFVVQGGRAIRRDVTLGVASFDEVEIVSGLSVGDEVVVSDMKDYVHLDSVRIR